ncbi:hypothetical protein roselon_01370 [Roseibacterium elongatum DSM 19469]|uniref:non-specific protein-tyrosine kinase n=2 Tax=Roseicyclus elongatus TaxID=159346 RepID=W8RRN6_9RHOB|nr:hypothetical protein roselon_01370 [Roseibacterium elongatum DSM 19469]
MQDMTSFPSNGPEQDSQDEIDLVELLRTIWRGKWVIVLTTVLGILFAVYQAFVVAVPLYPARATVAVESGDTQMVISEIDSVFSGAGTDSVALNTEIEVILSRDLIGQLVDDLDLVADPEFNGALRDLPFRTRALNWVRGIERALPSDARMRASVIDSVINRVNVENLRSTRVFNIEIETTDPQKSAMIVNRLAGIYIDSQIRRKLDATTRAISFLSDRTTELQANVAELERQLAAQTEESNVVSADLVQAQNIQLRELRERIEDQAQRLADEQSILANLVSARGDFDALISAAEASGESRLLSITQRFRMGRLDRVEANAAVEDVIATLIANSERAAQQLETLRQSESDLASRIAAQSAELIALQQLEREVNAARLLYETFLTRLQEASVQQGLETADARVLSEAVPRGASSPRKSLYVMLGLMLGALLGIAIVLVREWRFAGFRTTDELRDLTGMPVLGTVPALPTTDRREVLALLNSQPNSVFSEAVRNLRTSILMASIDRQPQVILMTSSIPSEGKTTLAIALSRLLGAMEGKRALLLEADIRRQTLRAYVDHDPGASLADVLLGRLDLDAADLLDPDLGVDVLSGGEAKVNAVDLFSSRRFGDLMEALRHRYDYIVIDAPPVLAVPDARVLAAYADVTVFAARWSSTSKTQLRQGLQMLETVGHPADGIVMSQVDLKKLKTYGYAGQYGYDSYSSKYYSTQS